MAETTMNLPHYEGKEEKGTFGPKDHVYTRVGNRWMQCRVEAVTSSSAVLTNAGMTPASAIYENPPEDSKDSNVAELLRRLKITDQEDDDRLIDTGTSGWALKEDTTKKLLEGLWDKAVKAEIGEASARAGMSAGVTATIVTSKNKPADGKAVTVIKNGTTVASGTTGADGKASFSLPLGFYKLHSTDDAFADVPFEVAVHCAEPPTATITVTG